MDKNSIFLVSILVILAVGVIGFGAMMAQKQKSASGSPLGLEESSTSTAQTITLPDATAGWLVYTDPQGIFSFKYPASFGTNVWNPVKWPPAAVNVDAGQDPVAIGCPDIHDETGKTPIGVAGLTAAGADYDLYVGSDIGAGQLYSSYCYVFPNNNGGAAVIDFVIHSHSACGFGGCGAYCGTQYEAECTNLDRKTAIVDPIQQMAGTFVFTGAVTGVTSPAAGAEKTITLADDQTNVALKVGDRFLVKLGEDYGWNVTVADQTIASRVIGITVIRGAQGVYEIKKAGDTDLTATGDPVCRSATPPCAAPSRQFTVHLVAR